MEKNKAFILTTFSCFMLLCLGAQAETTANQSATSHSIIQDIKKVLENSEVLKAEKSRFDAATERYNQAYRNFLPDIRANLSYGVQRAKQGDRPREQFAEQNYAVTLTQDLYTGGQLTAESEKERYKMEQASARYNLTQNEEILKYFNIYILLYSNIESQLLSLKNIELLEETVKKLEQQVNAGEAADVDINQAESRLKVEIANLQRLSSENAVLSVRYRNLVNQDVPKKFGSPHKYCKLFPDRDAIYNTVLSNNPRLIAAKYGIKSAHEDYNIADSQNMPRLAFVATQSYREGQSVFFQDENDTLSGILQLTVPIFERGLVAPRKREAKALENAALHDFASEKIAIIEEFEELFRFHQVTELTINAQKDVVSTNKKLLEAAMEEQRLGFKSVYELLEIERDLVESEFELIQNQAEHAFAACRILSLQGLLGTLENPVDHSSQNI